MRIKKAKFACYADPPCPAIASVTHIQGKILTQPKSWLLPKAKKAALHCPIGEYDRITDKLIPIKGASILNSSWDKFGGLIIVGEIPLDYLIDETVTSLCACLLHSVSCVRNNITYISQVLPTGFIPQTDTGGCNPGAFLHFPGAEKFSINVLQRRIEAMKDQQLYFKNFTQLRQFINTPKVDTTIIQKHFPNLNLHSNKYLDQYEF